ncbi:hypothetical protein BT96DRAFT_933099 [Gymnopus androsaceus JB14]|uniref:Uncharacterized protein n=1 Tax=Gymnopus androsaceus JB14 TaxID=1447944 RepID=A0A6A4IFW7_9AGAR|nr:hypothetical protein BT96DRAFT_933099 [Gymnopus androsaceus JB14]
MTSSSKMNRNATKAKSAAKLCLPSAITQAQLSALQRVVNGDDICQVKQKFYEKARASILALMHQYKTRLTLNEGLSSPSSSTAAAANSFSVKTANLSSKATAETQLLHPQPLYPQNSLNTSQHCAWRMQPPLDLLNLAGNSGPAYVVYLGINQSSGFYHRYQDTNSSPGAESIAPAGLHGQLLKSFPTVQAVKSAYEECLQTGVLALLREEEMENTVYIVTKEFEPGVYTTKKNVLIEGLNWCSGKVTCTKSTVAQAEAIFELWNALAYYSFSYAFAPNILCNLCTCTLPFVTNTLSPIAALGQVRDECLLNVAPTGIVQDHVTIPSKEKVRLLPSNKGIEHTLDSILYWNPYA